MGQYPLVRSRGARYFRFMLSLVSIGLIVSVLVLAFVRLRVANPLPAPTQSIQAAGPLRVDAANPRYFVDGTGRAILLTGSHTWSNFQDNGGSDPPPVFDYSAYLNFLQANHHNFFRLWTWEQSRWTAETSDNNYWFNPMAPYQRTGPGTALDGKPKFDLTQFDQSYFDRLRQRVIDAGNRGIYVSVMLFNGWSVDPNGDNIGVETEELSIPAVTAFQEAYVRKVVDTVNDLDNVLYEICNECADPDSWTPGSVNWQYHFIDYIHNYEASKPKQHPVGLSSISANPANLFASHADWIAPSGNLYNPPATTGNKVVMADTDHICGICGDRTWVWEAFTRGYNPLFMDGYDGAGYGVGGAGFNFNDPKWISLRLNLGYALTYANRMNLAAMTPHGELASSGYALANPAASGAEYLVYLPAGATATSILRSIGINSNKFSNRFGSIYLPPDSQVTVDLSAVNGELQTEWFNPGIGEITEGGLVEGGVKRIFKAPFIGDAVLYLHQS